MRPGLQRIRRTATQGLGIVLLGFLFVTGASAQNFDLTSAKPSDKIAQSKFFTIDSNRVLNAFDSFCFTAPSALIHDSVFIVAGIRATLSSAKTSGLSEVREFALEQNFPNPFNPSTTIRYIVGKRARISLVLFDLAGRQVTTLVDETKDPGTYSIVWNGKNSASSSVASGTYFYRLLTTSEDGTVKVESKRMTLVK